MAVYSQNGLTANDRSVIRSETIPGTDVKVAVRKGPVGDILLRVAARWHKEVEPLRASDGVLDCWGYAERAIRGSSTTLSNHASGSALDFRARAHPLGITKAKNYTPAQIGAAWRIITDFQGLVRWGGDYDDPFAKVPANVRGVAGSRPDPMHVEVVGSENACAAWLARNTGSTATPTPATNTALPEDDEVRIPITEFDAAGRFHEAVGAEAGGGSRYAPNGVVTFGSTYGATTWTVAALSGDGKVLAYWANVRTNNNTNVARDLPAGTRCVTVEGQRDNTGTRPWASYWPIR